MDHISVLVYGKPGAGKSVFAQTFPKALIFDFDNGHKLYAKHFPDNKVITEADGDMLMLLQQAVAKIESKDAENKDFAYQTLVIDSLTNLENKAVAAAKGMNKNNWATQLYSGKGKALGYQEWGNISGSSIALLTYIRQLPINLVVISQIDTTYDNGSVVYKPNLVGKGQDEASHFADFVLYFEVVNSDSGITRLAHMHSKDGDNFVAKSRLMGGYHDALKNPSYEKLAKIISEDTPQLNFSE